MRSILALIVMVTAISILAVGQNKTAAGSKAPFVPVVAYDPSRDAAKDIQAAVEEAGRTHRNVMVEIGGKWCIWCAYLDKFFDQNASLREFRDQKYVIVKVNFSPENKNEKALSKYPEIGGYPHIFILGPDGKLLQSQDTSKLEEGRGYSSTAVAKFLEEWAPKS